MIERARKRLSKRAKRGFRGWPLATVALYGPDDSTATKLTLGIVPGENADATDLRRWFSKEQTDIRDDIPSRQRSRDPLREGPLTLFHGLDHFGQSRHEVPGAARSVEATI